MFSILSGILGFATSGLPSLLDFFKANGYFDENNVFIYSTSTHIKYMFSSECKTTGTFKSIEEPVYVAFFMKNQIYVITR